MLKRRLSLLLLVALFVPVLAACGNETPTATPAAPTAAPTTATTPAEGATSTTATGGGEATATTAATAPSGGATSTTAAGGTIGAPATTGVLNVFPSGQQTTAFVRNFNPFAANPLYPIYGIYEPLMVVNVIKGELTPWLADKYTWSSDNKTLTFTLHDGVKWSDGQPLSANDVLYTFNLLKSNPALQGSGIQAIGSNGYVSSVSAPDDKTVVFNFSRIYTPGIYDIARQPIVPQHIWKDISDPVKYTNDNPVGTGPFTQVTSFQSQVYQIDKNPYYWQAGKPYVNALRVFAFGGNEQASVAFAQGTIDWSGFFAPNMDQAVISKDPANLHYWFPPGNLMILFMVNTTKKPFDDPVVRKAISMSFNREQMIAIGLSGYSKPADVTGVSDVFKDWKPSDPNTLGDWTTYNPTKANQMLDDAGYKKGGDGIRTAPDGTKLSFEFMMINGFTDWIAAGPTIVNDLKAIGIQANLRNYDFGVAFSNWQQGKFDMSLTFGTAASTPYEMYRSYMSKDTVVPVGQAAGQNYWRYSDAKVDPLLTQWAATSDASQQKQFALQVAQLFAQDAPVIPMWPQPIWNDYSTKRFTGWPSADNPYAFGIPVNPPYTGGENLLVITTVKPK